MPGTRKTAVILISDGLDRGSKTPYDKMLNELQEQKREMIDSVIQAGGQSVTSLTKEELMQMLEI